MSWEEERDLWRREDVKARAGHRTRRPHRIGEILRPTAADKQRLAYEMRRTPTPAEASLGSLLEREWPGRFQSQVPLNGWIVDLFDVESQLVIELDGNRHIPERDAERDASLTRHGYTTLRFSNDHLREDPASVLAMIAAMVR